MLQRFFSSKDRQFFPLFQEQADLIAKTGTELLDLIHSDDPQIRLEKQKAISKLEHEGDQCVHNVLQKLYQTFFTPYDHYDIKDLVLRMDDVLDEIDSVSNLCVLYHLSKKEPYIEPFVVTIQKSSEAVAQLIEAMNQPKKIRPIFQHINTLEHAADEILSKSLSELFESQKDALTVIKFKEVYERLEAVTDRCKDVSDVVEAIVLKYM